METLSVVHLMAKHISTPMMQIIYYHLWSWLEKEQKPLNPRMEDLSVTLTN